MNCGLYIHGNNVLTTLLKREFRSEGVNFNVYNCLCLDGVNRKLEDMVVIHPEYNNSKNCWETIKKEVEHHPKTRFYILAFGTPERGYVIGKHPNVKYLDYDNGTDRLNEIIQLGKKYSKICK